ncbi:hypothetical protein NL676_008942 [Syzygium grande]|nr:hypothetical protein NL676_008942 [Syzygium grande]
MKNLHLGTTGEQLGELDHSRDGDKVCGQQARSWQGRPGHASHGSSSGEEASVATVLVGIACSMARRQARGAHRRGKGGLGQKWGELTATVDEQAHGRAG